MVHESQSGGSMSTISRTTVPSKPRTRLISDTRSKVPKRPDVTFLIDAIKLTAFPHNVLKTSLMKRPNAEGIRNSATSAPLATTRHLTSAEIVCVSRASSSIQNTLAITIELAIHRLSLNQVKPSRYDWKKNRINCGTHVTSDSRISSTDILPITYSVRENGRQR